MSNDNLLDGICFAIASALRSLAFVLLAFVGASTAFACDPNESCHRCLVSAFGNCITEGNDPACEMRKAACRQTPVIVNTPGSPFGTGGALAKGGPVPGLSGDQVKDCIGDLQSCPGNVLARLSYEAIRPVVESYIGYLEHQVGNNAQQLPGNFISLAQPFYQIPLQNVRYAQNIDTIHGSTITIGNMIYFTNSLDLDDPNDAALMYHELQHVVQYARKGGIPQFMTEYVLKSGGSMIKGGNSIDIHERIDLEQEANAKANEVASRVAMIGSQPVTSQPGFFPAPVVGSICRTPIGGCQLPGVGPIGMSCSCFTPNGPVFGFVNPN